MDQPSELSGRIDAALDAVLDGKGAVSLATQYFDPEGPFAARSFHADGDNDPGSLGRDDLLAVTLLDVRFRPLALRQLLAQPSDGSQWLDESVLPAGLCLWEAEAKHLDALSDFRSWLMHGTDLGGHDGVGYVIADKIAARKRPHLVPIVDQAIRRVVGPIGSRREFWAVLGARLTAARRNQLEVISGQVGGDPIPALRLLDALLWMHGSNSTNAKNARREAGVTAHRV